MKRFEKDRDLLEMSRVVFLVSLLEDVMLEMLLDDPPITEKNYKELIGAF